MIDYSWEIWVIKNHVTQKQLCYCWGKGKKEVFKLHNIIFLHFTWFLSFAYVLYSFLSVKSLIILQCPALELLPLLSLLLFSQAVTALIPRQFVQCDCLWLNYEPFKVSDCVFFIFMSQHLAYDLEYNYSINIFRKFTSQRSAVDFWAHFSCCFCLTVVE